MTTKHHQTTDQSHYPSLDALRRLSLTRRSLLASAFGGVLLIACGSDEDDGASDTGAGGSGAGGSGASTGPSTGASGGSGASGTRVFQDSLGNSVEIPTQPQRVVALHDYNSATIMLSLGVTPVGSVGRKGGLSVLEERYDVADVTFLGQFGEPDIEAIAGLQPDLIVGAVRSGAPGWIPKASEATLRQIAPTIFIDHLRPVSDVSADYAEALAVETDFEALKAAYEARIASITEEHAETLSGLTVSVASFYYMQWGINTPDSPTINGVLSDLGVTQLEVEADSPDRDNFISAERIREVDADLLIILRYSEADPRPEDVTLYSDLAAVQAGQAYEVNGNAWIEHSYQALDVILDAFEEWLPSLDTTVVA